MQSTPPNSDNPTQIAMLLGQVLAKQDNLSDEIRGVKNDVGDQIKDLKVDIQRLRDDMNADLGEVELRLTTLERDLGDRPMLIKEHQVNKEEIEKIKELVHRVQGGLTMSKIVFGVAGAIPMGLLVWLLSVIGFHPVENHQQFAPTAQVEKVK